MGCNHCSHYYNRNSCKNVVQNAKHIGTTFGHKVKGWLQLCSSAALHAEWITLKCFVPHSFCVLPDDVHDGSSLDNKSCSPQIILAVFLLGRLQLLWHFIISCIILCFTGSRPKFHIQSEKFRIHSLCMPINQDLKSSMYNFISIKIAGKMKQPSAKVTQNLHQKNCSDYLSVIPVSLSFSDHVIQSSHCRLPSNSYWVAHIRLIWRVFPSGLHCDSVLVNTVSSKGRLLSA